MRKKELGWMNKTFVRSHTVNNVYQDYRVAAPKFTKRKFVIKNPQQMGMALDFLKKHEYVDPDSVRAEGNFVVYNIDAPTGDTQAADLAVQMGLEGEINQYSRNMPEFDFGMASTSPEHVTKMLRSIASRIDKSPRPNKNLVIHEIHKLLKFLD